MMTLRLKHLKRLSTFTAGQPNDQLKRNSPHLFSSLPRLEETRAAGSWDSQLQKEEWNRIRTVVCELFQSKYEYRSEYTPSFEPGQLAALHEDVHALLLSKAGTFIFEFYQKSLLPAAAQLLMRNIENGASDLVANLTAAWHHFFTHVLPALEAIFLNVKDPGGLTVRKATLLVFRDLIVLKLAPQLEDILSELFEEGSVSPALRQMFLVLMNVQDCYPPSAQRLRFEALTARVVSPYLGFRGLYNEGRTVPDLPSKELEVAHLRRISVVDPRKLTRPLSVNSSLHMATLNDLFTLSLDRQFKRTSSRENV